MPQPLSTQQLLDLATQYTQIAKTLEQYANAHADDPDVDLAELQQMVSDLDDVAQNLANDGLATLFDNSAQAYANLSATTRRANEIASSLAKERNQFTRIAGIATSMIGVAVALGSGNPATLVAAIAKCGRAVNG